MNDRQRVELLLFVDLLQHVVECGANDADAPEAKAAVAYLVECRKALARDITQDALTKIIRRVARLDHEAIGPIRIPGQPVAGVGLVVYVLLRDLTESGYLVFAEDGPFDKAIRLVLPPLNEFAETPGALANAESKAATIFATMKAAGYLQGFGGAK